MTWRSEKTRTGLDFVYDGAEFGISPSPTKGTANLQNVNISTESGEVMASYGRTAQQQTAITNGTLTPDGATNFTGPSTLKAGTWIRVSASTVTSITAATNPASVTADYLVVAGGGGGGATTSATRAGGGGGAGAVRTGTNAFSVGSTVVTVGTGGASATSGGDSVLGSIITSSGGGKGGDGDAVGTAGGSGGGGGAITGGSNRAGGAGTTGGNNGGTSNAATNGQGGGGGGAGAVGGTANATDAGAGGAGTTSSISGTSVTYGGGGGGGSTTNGNGSGGAGGGGLGGATSAGTAGTAGTGGGGGGAGGGTYSGGAGGSGIVVISYTTGAMVATGGTITHAAGKTIHTFTTDGVFTVVSIATGGLYYVSYASGTTFKLSANYDPTGANALTHGTTGSITFSTVAVPNSMVAKATEKYTTASAAKYRYYMLDTNSYVWVWDTAIYETYGTQWMLPDPNDYSTLKMTGMAVLNGFLLTVGIASIYGKPTVNIGDTFQQLTNAYLNEPFASHRNFAFTGNQGKMYYCDGNYIGELFATTSLVTSIANIQSYCSFTASSTTGTLTAVISGSMPYDSGGTRIPAVFFTDVYGTRPTNLTENTVYYIQINPANKTFEVYSAITGGSAINIATGVAGNQYFNTFYPFGTIAGIGGSSPLVQYSNQRVNLPANETAQCMVEVGNTVLIAGSTNLIYPWNQIDATPSDFIALPENDVKTMVNVNNMAYVFAGNKGNVYITNNSVASLALKVPDYCAGVPGTPLTYIEPRFTWGDADYVRGRVYFSILDQTATKAGNCGGIWSFVPSQNIDPSQEVGMALRLENQNSYGDYDGYATIILPAQDQNATSPQYWSAWQDGISNPAYGIDFTATTPVTQYVIETDILPSGTFLEKGTFQQLEYKLTTALASGDSVQIYYRLDATSAWTTCGTVNEETTDKISGYFNQVFQKTQWVQFRIVVTTGGTTASSFVRFKQLMLR